MRWTRLTLVITEAFVALSVCLAKIPSASTDVMVALDAR
jgi:hypothetical protein